MEWRAVDGEVVEWAYGLGLPDALLLAVTHVATRGGLWLLAGLALLAFGRGMTRRTGAALLTGLVLHLGLLETALKHLVARPRPCATLGLAIRDTVVDATTYSFPSGHSAASFLAAWIIGVRFPRWRNALLLVAGLVAASRVALGAHYPSDVTAGAALGLMLGIAVARAFRLEPATGAWNDGAPPGAPVGESSGGAH